jgi:hypothetical protein
MFASVRGPRETALFPSAQAPEASTSGPFAPGQPENNAPALCAIRDSAEQGHPVQSGQPASWRLIEDPMLLIVGAVVVLIAGAILPRIRAPGGANGKGLGWMSARWLAQHRASQSP